MAEIYRDGHWIGSDFIHHYDYVMADDYKAERDAYEARIEKLEAIKAEYETECYALRAVTAEANADILRKRNKKLTAELGRVRAEADPDALVICYMQGQASVRNELIAANATLDALRAALNSDRYAEDIIAVMCEILDPEKTSTSPVEVLPGDD